MVCLQFDFLASAVILVGMVASYCARVVGVRVRVFQPALKVSSCTGAYTHTVLGLIWVQIGWEKSAGHSQKQKYLCGTGPRHVP